MTSRIPGENAPAPLRGEPELAFATGRAAGLEALESLGVAPTGDDDLVGQLKDAAEANEKTALESSESRRTDSVGQGGHDFEAIDVGVGLTATDKVHRMEEIALYALHVDDDPSLNPWTFRTWFLVGCAL